MAKLEHPSLLITLAYLSIFLSHSSSSLAYNIVVGTVSSPSFAASPTKSPWQRLNQAAYVSLTRAHNIKFSQPPRISPRFGAYTISFKFGTPPQTLPLILDAGSSPMWLPCTRHYNCSGCDDYINTSTFIPELSTSARILGCNSSQCRQFAGNQCEDCHEGSHNCTQFCPYRFTYGIGSTSGFFLSEILHFSASEATNFTVGCSTETSSLGYGIVGFALQITSFPAQMGLKMFAYCLVSHKFDDTSKTSQLIMVRRGGDGGDNSNSQSGLITFTPFARAPAKFQSLYYVTVTKITVGRVDVKVPHKHLVPGLNGNGGTVVDSGTTLTVMDEEIFELVLTEYEKQMAQYRRADDANIGVQLSPCYNMSGENPGNFPELNFYFEGGGKMAFPMSDNYEPYPEIVCLAVMSAKSLRFLGPSIILGNYQQQNLYMEFDLENGRLGFRKQIC